MMGVGTPAARPRRTTEPGSDSTSIRLPICRSISSDDRVAGGSTSTYFTTYAISASWSRSATPSARATDSTSRTAAEELLADRPGRPTAGRSAGAPRR